MVWNLKNIEEVFQPLEIALVPFKVSKLLPKAIFLLFAVYLLIGWIVYLNRTASMQRKTAKQDSLEENPQVNPSIYDTDYYLYAYGNKLERYIAGLGQLPVSLKMCFNYANPSAGEKVLDLGCGRGELAYHCAIKGCSVTAIDYSNEAIKLALKTKQALPAHLKQKMIVKQMDFKELELGEPFDIVFMADLIEHLYSWELERLFQLVRKLLRPGSGRLIIHTAPNKTWIRVILPLKRILGWPNTLRKRKDFCYKRDKYSYDPQMHVNEQTPRGIRELLKFHGFQARVWCSDGSSNIVSMLTKRFAGAEIWAVARIAS